MGSPGGRCASIGRALRPSAGSPAPIGCGRRARRCRRLIEAQGGEREVINPHPSPIRNHLTTLTDSSKPLKANEFDLLGCKNTRNRTEDAMLLALRAGVRL